MRKFNLQKLLERLNIEPSAIAPVLFPNVRFPELALNRTLKENLPINVDQLYDLADFVKVPVEWLFSESWLPENKSFTFTKGDYKIVMCGATVYLYKGCKLENILYISSTTTTVIQATDIAKYLEDILTQCITKN